jgi:hypothetical protein
MVHVSRSIIFEHIGVWWMAEGEEKRRWEHWEDLPEDMEKDMLERMARFFVGNNLGLMAQILLESGEPLTKVFATIGMGIFGPYLEFLGADAYTSYFRKEGNARKLLDRIEELEYERRMREEESRKKDKQKKEEKKES